MESKGKNAPYTIIVKLQVFLEKTKQKRPRLQPVVAMYATHGGGSHTPRLVSLWCCGANTTHIEYPPPGALVAGSDRPGLGVPGGRGTQ